MSPSSSGNGGAQKTSDLIALAADAEEVEAPQAGRQKGSRTRAVAEMHDEFMAILEGVREKGWTKGKAKDLTAIANAVREKAGRADKTTLNSLYQGINDRAKAAGFKLSHNATADTLKVTNLR